MDYIIKLKIGVDIHIGQKKIEQHIFIFLILPAVQDNLDLIKNFGAMMIGNKIQKIFKTGLMEVS